MAVLLLATLTVAPAPARHGHRKAARGAVDDGLFSSHSRRWGGERPLACRGPCPGELAPLPAVLARRKRLVTVAERAAGPPCTLYGLAGVLPVVSPPRMGSEWYSTLAASCIANRLPALPR